MAGKCIVNIGELREVVAIQSNSVVPDDFGQEIKTWATDATVRASVMPLTGKERFESAQVAPEVTHKITIGHGATVTAESRIVFETRIFNISSVINVEERDILLEIAAIESPES